MDKSKEQTKPVKLEMLEYVSSVALLKSIRQVRKIHDVEAEDFIEKKLMDLGVRAVYPNQPFKYGYKRFYLNKKHLIKNPIGVRAPLTDEQLKIVAEFVSLARLEQCNSDTKYLRILKSLLVQRCNVQNPDELDWDDILAHIEVFLCKTEQKTKLGEGGKTGKAEDAIIKESEKWPDDLITLAVAESKYHVTTLTLRRAIADGRLRSYRPKNCSKNHPHKVSESQVASYWPAKIGQQK